MLACKDFWQNAGMGNSEVIFSLVYASSALRPFKEDELVKLLEKCRENNSQLEVSGMLLYKDGNFLQVLEGDEKKVRALYEKVSKDPRHKGTKILEQSHLERREFPDCGRMMRRAGAEAA